MWAGGAATASRMMWLSALGTPAAGSSSSSTSGRRPSAIASQALPTAGQLGDAPRGVAGEAERLEQRHRLVHHVGPAARRPLHGRGRPDALGDRDVDVLQDRELATEAVVIWNVRAMPSVTCSAWPTRVMSRPLSRMVPEVGASLAGEQVHERRLARAVGADERVAGTGVQDEVDVARGGEGAEAPPERPGLEQRGAHAPTRRRGRRASAMPRMPFSRRTRCPPWTP
jgi:hypothetical protein